MNLFDYEFETAQERAYWRQQEEAYYGQMRDDAIEQEYEAFIAAAWESDCRRELEDELAEAMGLDPTRDYGGMG